MKIHTYLKMEEIKADISETKKEIALAKIRNDREYLFKLQDYLLELQRKENILLQQNQSQGSAGSKTVSWLVAFWNNMSKTKLFHRTIPFTFVDFKLWIISEFTMKSEFELYFIPNCDEYLVDKRKIESDADLMICMNQITSTKTRIFIQKGQISPTKIPSDNNKTDEISDLSSSVQTRGSVQTNFASGVLSRDSATCVFCGDQDKATLTAAHVFDIQRYNVEFDGSDLYLFNKFGIMTLYDVSNGITLCSACNDVFDANLCYVSTNEFDVDGKVIYKIKVADAILQFEAFKDKWLLLNGKNVQLPIVKSSSLMKFWPSLELFHYREQFYHKMKAERELFRETHPYILRNMLP